AVMGAPSRASPAGRGAANGYGHCPPGPEGRAGPSARARGTGPSARLRPARPRSTRTAVVRIRATNCTFLARILTILGAAAAGGARSRRRWRLRRRAGASALGGAEARRRQRGRDRGGLLLQQRERLGDPAGQLRVLARDPGVRRQRHLDVRLHSVVLDRPVLALEPAGVLRLGDAGAVDQVVAAVDADHAAPGAGADD